MVAPYGVGAVHGLDGRQRLGHKRRGIDPVTEVAAGEEEIGPRTSELAQRLQAGGAGRTHVKIGNNLDG